MKKLLAIIVLLSLGATTYLNAADYRSKKSGTWSTASNWETYNGADWVDASGSPGSGDDVTIRNSHELSQSYNGKKTFAVNTLLIELGGGFILSNSSNTLTITGTITVEGRMEINVTKVIDLQGVLTVNGELEVAATSFNNSNPITGSGSINSNTYNGGTVFGIAPGSLPVDKFITGSIWIGGGTDNNWLTTNNWLGVAPDGTSSDDALVYSISSSSTSVDPILPASVTGKTLYVNSGSTFTISSITSVQVNSTSTAVGLNVGGTSSSVGLIHIESGGTINIGSTAVPTDGDVNIGSDGKFSIEPYGFVTIIDDISNSSSTNLVIESTSVSTGSLIFGSGTPAATVERFVPDGEWHYIGVAVDGAIANDFRDVENNELVWLAELGADNTWSYLIDENSSVNRGQGYTYLIDASIRTDKTLALEGNLTADWSSNPYSLHFDPAATGADNTWYTFIGNPYTSSLDITKMDEVETEIEHTVWVWDNTLNDFLWASMTDPSVSNSGNYPAGADPSAIAIGQGFYLRAIQSGASYGYDPLFKAHKTDAVFYKNKDTIPGHSGRLNIRLSKDGKNDLGIVSFAEDGSTAFENGLDISKLMGGESNSYIFFVEEDHKYCKSHLSSLQDGEYRVVDIYTKVGSAGEHSITVELDQFSIATVTLEDLVTGDMINLDETPVYTFNAEINGEELRFRLHFNAMYTDLEELEINQQETIGIYSFDKSVFISNNNVDKSNQVDIIIYDIFGRKIFQSQQSLESLTSIPVNISNNYLVVKVVSGNNIVTKKVFVK